MSIVKTFLVSILLAPVYVGIFYLLYSSKPIQDKLEQSKSDSRSSYTIRYADNMALMQMISEKPLFGYGLGTREFNTRSLQLDNETSSNGDLFFAALFGIPFYLFVLLQCAVRAKDFNLPRWLFVLFFILFNIAECFLYYPLVFLFFIKLKTSESIHLS